MAQSKKNVKAVKDTNAAAAAASLDAISKLLDKGKKTGVLLTMKLWNPFNQLTCHQMK